MTYEELKQYLIDCCNNGVSISYNSLKKEIDNNPEEFHKMDLPDITRKWRRSSSYIFYNMRGKKTEYKFIEVYRMEIQKTNCYSEEYIFTAYIVPTSEAETNEIHVLGVTKHPWSYELAALNKDQYKKYSQKVQPPKTITYRS